MKTGKSRMARILARTLAGAAVLLGACGEAEQENEVPAAAGPLPDEVYQPPSGFPLPFRTVLPEGFRAEPDLDRAADAVRFVWVPQGEPRDSSIVLVRVLAEEATEGAAREIVRTAAERTRTPGDRTELEPRNEHPWAVVEYPIASVGTWGQPVQGWVALGRRGERWFYVIVQSPVRVWPAFSAGAETILSRWRWIGAGNGAASDGLDAPP